MLRRIELRDRLRSRQAGRGDTQTSRYRVFIRSYDDQFELYRYVEILPRPHVERADRTDREPFLERSTAEGDVDRYTVSRVSRTLDEAVLRASDYILWPVREGDAATPLNPDRDGFPCELENLTVNNLQYRLDLLHKKGENAYTLLY
jgi:hypothetical protein